MSYGFDLPQGFVPIKPLNGAPLTASDQQLPIKNGYTNNIWTGDLVIASTTGNGGLGYMINLFDYIVSSNTGSPSNPGPGGVNNTGGYPILGVFAGCSYTSATDTTNPALPRRTNWQAGTQTSDGRDAVGYYIPANYEYGFSVQCDATAPTQSVVGRYTTVVYRTTTPLTNPVLGTVQTGQSLVSVTMAQLSPNAIPVTVATTTGAATTWNTFQIVGLDYSQGPSGAAVPFGNVIIRLANTSSPFQTIYPTRGV